MPGILLGQQRSKTRDKGMAMRGNDEVPGEDVFQFSPEEPSAALIDTAPLLVLSVDDDPGFQRSLRAALQGYRYQDQPLRLLTARSAEEAATLMVATPELAVVLLDVVMETDDAGLRLVRYVREVQGNADVRIVLLTGQPGMAPMQASLGQLDISDYWLKTELSQERLHSILTGNLRTWQQIRALSRAKRGLQAIVEASNSLTLARGLEDFSARMICELSSLLGVAPDGLVCVQAEHTDATPLRACISAAAGRFSGHLARPLASLDDLQIRSLLSRAMEEQTAIATADSQVLFFPGTQGVPHAAAYLATDRHLDETEHELLRVFSTQVNSGLINVALSSRLDRIAYEDALLSIPNGNALLRELESVLALPPPCGRTLLLVDLDQYAESSLSLGVEQGDLMLQGMARRLRGSFPPPCLVARLHEDTFAILGPTQRLSVKQLHSLELLDESDHSPFIGIGAARLDLDAYSGSARGAIAAGLLLLKRARSEAALLCEYQPGMEAETSQRFQQSHALYHALRNTEGIRIVLQPQVDLLSGRVLGAEVLARWVDTDGIEVPPGVFIPIAEANGLIVPLGKRILEMACAAVREIDQAGFPDLTLAVNVSPLQLARHEFLEELAAVVRQHGIRPERIELEVTESAAMNDQQAGGTILRSLKAAGFSIAIDDFGTGYSSLSYLHSICASTLKVDQRFVREIGLVDDDQSIADMIIALGRRMQMYVLAEGVETAEQADWLREHGCQRAQGYLFGRPEPLDAFIERLRERDH
ncbi:putative bifunctional diguanylate cyclase/phosphodiesterase [Pseudomonas delhiensis]|uniref:putative bifunctional diguanylate cyclase/phosphodiesterase n=1 Tax=Pseudomonas delhiensis TaxID=366289 RepID=UPI00315A171F